MIDVANTLEIAEKLLRSNRYIAEADMCKAAIAKATAQERALREFVKWADEGKVYGFAPMVNKAREALK